MRALRLVDHTGEQGQPVGALDKEQEGPIQDKIDFICDFYSYDGKYQDSYMMGEQMTVDGSLTISDVTLPDGKVRLTYRLTDIYNQAYWTETISH